MAACAAGQSHGHGTRCAGAPQHRLARRWPGRGPWTASPVPVRGGDAPPGPGLSCFAPSPAELGLGPCGLRSPSRAPRLPHVGSRAAWLRGHRSRRVSAWTSCAAARMGSVATVRRCGRKEAGHRPLRTSSALDRGGGSSSQMSFPGNTMPPTRLPSASTARKTLAAPEGDARDRWRPKPPHPTRSRTCSTFGSLSAVESAIRSRGPRVRASVPEATPRAGSTLCTQPRERCRRGEPRGRTREAA